jgi:SAM-dependent methyltransferase
MSLPSNIIANRARIAASYLTGSGIEIGALDSPTPLPPGAKIRYVDIHTAAELRKQFTKLADASLVTVDIVDDGEKLAAVDDASLDFIVANHMLEHCENPLGTLRHHLRKVRPGGWLFYAVPEMRCCFDSVRPLTTFDHLLTDDADGGAGSRRAHLVEWVTQVAHVKGSAEIDDRIRDIERRGVTIHFHVWDSNAWLDHLCRARHYLAEPFEIRHFELVGPEIISVLRRS